MDDTPTHDRKKELSAVVKSIRTVDGQIKELRNSKATSESDGKQGRLFPDVFVVCDSNIAVL